MKLSLVVPCYNEAENVMPFQEAVMEAFKNCNYDYEIIFINDGSKDATFHNLKKIFSELQIPFSTNKNDKGIILTELKIPYNICFAVHHLNISCTSLSQQPP